MAKKKRLTDTMTAQEAGCHGCDKKWATGNANQMAALHHDKTGHKTWCKIVMDITYGKEEAPAAIAQASVPPVPAPTPELVNFRCSKCGLELGVHDHSVKLTCRKCGGPGIAYVEAAPSEWREPMADGDLTMPKPIEPEQSIEEFLAGQGSSPETARPPKSIEELIEDRVNPKPIEAGPKFEM